jgi:hypothetical protein
MANLEIYNERTNTITDRKGREMVEFHWSIDGVLDRKQDEKLFGVMDTRTGVGIMHGYTPATGFLPQREGRVQTSLSFACLPEDAEEVTAMERRVVTGKREAVKAVDAIYSQVLGLQVEAERMAA